MGTATYYRLLLSRFSPDAHTPVAIPFISTSSHPSGVQEPPTISSQLHPGCFSGEDYAKSERERQERRNRIVFGTLPERNLCSSCAGPYRNGEWDGVGAGPCACPNDIGQPPGRVRVPKCIIPHLGPLPKRDIWRFGSQLPLRRVGTGWDGGSNLRLPRSARNDMICEICG